MISIETIDAAEYFAVSVPGAVATGSGGTLETERYFQIRSLPLPVLTPPH